MQSAAVEIIRYVFDPIEVEDVDSVRITSDGIISELYQGHTVTSLTLGIPVVSVHRLALLTSSPHLRFYVFLAGTDLVIVQRHQGHLQISETKPNVTGFTIADRLNLGRPQVVIESAGRPDEVIDPTRQSLSVRATSGFSTEIQTQLQMMKVRLLTAEKVKADKNCLIHKLSRSYNFGDDHSVESLVCAFGASLVLKADLVEVLDVGALELKEHLNKWVVTVPIQNLTDKTLAEFNICVSIEAPVEKTILFPGAKSTSFDPVEGLGSAQSGFLVGVLPRPVLTSKMTNLTCVARFKCDGETATVYLGEIRVDVKECLTGRFSLVNDLTTSDLTTSDLLVIAATSEITSCGTSDTSISSALHHFNFKEIQKNVFINLSETEFKFSLVNRSSHRISFFVKPHLTALLIHGLCDLGVSLFKLPRTSEARQLLGKELLFTKEVLLALMENEERDNLKDARRLAALEMATVGSMYNALC